MPSAKTSPDPASRTARRVVGECKLFRALSERGRDELSKRALIRNFARGQTIFVMGDKGDSLIAVLAGQVRISIASPGGRDVLLAMIGPGEIFGEIAVLDGRPRTADASPRPACGPCGRAL